MDIPRGPEVAELSPCGKLQALALSTNGEFQRSLALVHVLWLYAPFPDDGSYLCPTQGMGHTNDFLHRTSQNLSQGEDLDMVIDPVVEIA